MTTTTPETTKKRPAPHDVHIPAGPAVNDAVTHAPPIVMALLLADIDESPSNPRKTFRGIEDLAENVKRKGVLEPVLVRPSPKGVVGRFELVFGARRFRASKLAGLPDIPAMVRTLSDEEVLEIQIIENSKREDIHPMEEADGYRALHETHGWTVEDIAARVGKSVATVRQRLKLCGLVPAAREAFLADRFTAGVALILARVPHADLQAKALAEILRRQGGPGEDPVSVTDASWIVQSGYMLVLAEAPFDRKSLTLVAGAPDCGACPKRTGNQRDLFPDISAKDDLCTDPKCWDAKKNATWVLEEAAARAKGAKVISAKEAKNVFSPYGSNDLASKVYVDLDAKTYDGRGKPHDNRALIKSVDVPVVLARDPSGRTRKLVVAADFRAAAKAAGNAEKLGRTAAATDSRSSAELAAEKRKRAKEASARAASEAELVELVAVAEKDSAAGAEFWRTFARAITRIVWADSRAAVAKRRAMETKSPPCTTEDLVLENIAWMSGAQARGLAVEFVLGAGRGDVAQTRAEFVELYGLGTKPKKKAAAKPNPKPKPKASKR